MITLSPAYAAMFYLLLTLGALTVAWIFEHRRAKRRKLIQNPEELYLCEYCHAVYTADPIKKINRCPECKSLNKGNELRDQSQNR